jgi:hypothetical protein
MTREKEMNDVKPPFLKFHFPTFLLTGLLCLVGGFCYFYFSQGKSSHSLRDANLQKVATDAELNFSLKDIPKKVVVKENFNARGLTKYQKPYKLTEDWVSRYVPLWENLLSSYKGKPNLSYLEIGVYEGGSLFWFLENICTDPTSKVTGIDPFVQEGVWDKIKHNAKISGAEDRITIIKGFSQTELRKLPLEAYDIIYIDGDHLAPGVLEDAVHSWRLLKSGGVFIFDDYLQNMDWPPEQRPKPAIDCFYRFFGDGLTLLHNNYQVIFKKH